MLRPVIAGVDGSAESLAAADWAAREARRREVPLHLVHACQGEPAALPRFLPGPATVRHWAEGGLRKAGAALARRYPDLLITTDQVSSAPQMALSAAAEKAELLVLGSRGLSGLTGFLVGSVGQAVVAHAHRPVVLVRGGESAEGERTAHAAGQPSSDTAYRDVVLGLGLQHPCDPLLAFVFDAAARCGASLHAVHAWSFPPIYGYAPEAIDPRHSAELETREMHALAEVLRPWREKFPQVPVAERSVPGRAAQHLVHSAAGAGLLVVGCRMRRATGVRIGPVTHAVLHHAPCPVAVVPHG